MRGWIAAAAWLVVSAAQAQDCDRQKLDAGERLSAYLRVYSQDCVAKPAETQLQRWKIRPATEEANLALMVAAWRDLSDAFARLHDEAPPAARTKEAYRLIAERARIAGVSLSAALQQKASPDIAAFRRDAWQIQPQMTLFELNVPGEPTLPVVDVGAALDADCATPQSALCQNALKQGRELMLSWRLASRLATMASASTLRALAKQIGEKDALWDRYLYDSKPMMLFDFAFTDLMEGRWGKSDQYPDGVPVPPRNQWFLLHPSFAVEYASAAADGQQMKPVAYLEVAGVNRWNDKDRWIDVPVLRWFSGAGLVVSYADREGIKDTGYGLVLTFENVYTIGFTRYGSENGIFLSLDLANLFRDKLKPQYQAARIMMR